MNYYYDGTLKLQNYDQPFAEKFASALNTAFLSCRTLEDYVNFVFNFRFDSFSIEPLQIKEEIYALMKILSKVKPKRLLEIGTSNGGTLFLLCKTASPNATVVSIDLPEGSFGGEFYPEWKKYLYEKFALNKQKIHLIRSDSHLQDTLQNTKDILNNNKIDFLLIDADHTYEGVRKDFEMYKDLVAEGGMIAFHDITPGPKENVGGVPQFWQEIKSKYPSFEIVNNETGQSYGIGLLFNSNNKKLANYGIILETLVELKDWQLAQLQIKTKYAKEKLENNPIGSLLSLYIERPDLQQAFAAVSKGDITSFVDWAIQICTVETVKENTAKQRIFKFYPWYVEFKRSLEIKAKMEQDLVNLSNQIKIYQTELAKLEQDRANKIEYYQTELAKLEQEKASQIEHYQTELAKLIQDRAHQITQYQKIIGQYTTELDAIKAGMGFRVIRFCGSNIDRILGRNSPIDKAKRTLNASKKIVEAEGVSSLLSHAKEKIQRGEFAVSEPVFYESAPTSVLPQIKNKVNPLTDTLWKEQEIPEPKYKVSVVIPTRADESKFRFIIDKIKEQKGLKNLEIILINSGPHDLNSLKKNADMKIFTINPEEFNHGQSRNLGASHATHDFILFLTDDAIPLTDHLFYDLCKVLSEDPKIAVATGRQIPKSDADLMYSYILKAHYGFLDLDKDRITFTDNFDDLTPVEKRRISQIDDVCSCFKREIFSRYQFSKIQYAEDLDMGIRLVKDGYKIAQLYSTGVIHSHNRPALYYLKRGFVDISILSELLKQDTMNFKELGVFSINDILGQAISLYNALGNTMDLVEKESTSIRTAFKLIHENLVQPLAGNMPKSRDDSLDQFFKVISIDPQKKTNKNYLVKQYLESIKNFEHYMNETYADLQNLENEFTETLYKIFADVTGNFLGNYVVYARKNNIRDNMIEKIEGILASGV